MMEHVRTATNIFLLSNLVIAVVSSSFYTFFTMVFVCNMIQYLIWSSIDKQNDINVNNYNLIFKDQIADLEDFRDRYHHVMNLAVKSHDAHLVDLVKRLDSYDEEKKCFKWDVESEDVVESWPSTPPAESPESDSDSLIVHRENVSDDPEVDKYFVMSLKKQLDKVSGNIEDTIENVIEEVSDMFSNRQDFNSEFDAQFPEPPLAGIDQN